MKRDLRVGLIAPKNTAAEIQWLSAFINAEAEAYRRGKKYDVVFFFNISDEIEWIKKHTVSKVFAVAIDSDAICKLNREARYIDLCDYYMGYKNFSGPDFRGEFYKLIFPAASTAEINEHFECNLNAIRRYTFSIFARHDPNIRIEIGDAIKGRNGLLVGPLFNNPVKDKMALQVQSKYEFITENVINDYYFSEKLCQALLAGCVPIYYGCSNIKKYIPDMFFVDLRDFQSIDDVIRYCSLDSVYEKYFDNIRRYAKNFLLKNSTWDKNVFAPLNDYLVRLEDGGFKSEAPSLWWKIEMAVRAMADRAVKATRSFCGGMF